MYINLNINKRLISTDPIIRGSVASMGLELDKLINDDSPIVRAIVAYKGYNLDKLVSDPHWAVRAAVADQKYALDKLIDDSDMNVKVCALINKCNLDRYELINHITSTQLAYFKLEPLKEEEIRDYTINELVNNSDWRIRQYVASKACRLDKLIDDSCNVVQLTAFFNINKCMPKEVKNGK